MKYENMSDEELAGLFQNGDVHAADCLMEQYKQMVRARARALYLAGGDREDLLQEGMLGLFRAIRTFRPGEASFKTYASVCISRQMYTAIETASRKKNSPLNYSVSIHELVEHQADHELGTAESPEAILIGREAAQQLQEKIREQLSRYERAVLERYLEGMDYPEIADALGKPVKSVDNALQRIRKKVSEILRQSGGEYRR